MPIPRKRRFTKPQAIKHPERMVRWQNMGPRSLETVEFDEDHIVREWIPLRIVSLPEEFSDQCRELKQLKRLGFAGN